VKHAAAASRLQLDMGVCLCMLAPLIARTAIILGIASLEAGWRYALERGGSGGDADYPDRVYLRRRAAVRARGRLSGDRCRGLAVVVDFEDSIRVLLLLLALAPCSSSAMCGTRSRRPRGCPVPWSARGALPRLRRLEQI
jgi:hypothetical protein